MCGRWWSDRVGEPYRMVALESKSSENEVEGIELCMGLSNNFPHHVWCMNLWDGEEHVCCQGENGPLMLYGVGGEGEDCSAIRCMGCGAHHMMAF